MFKQFPMINNSLVLIFIVNLTLNITQSITEAAEL